MLTFGRGRLSKSCDQLQKEIFLEINKQKIVHSCSFIRMDDFYIHFDSRFIALS